MKLTVKTEEEAERELGTQGKPGRTSRFEHVAQRWKETDENEAIVIEDLEDTDVQSLRRLLYRRFGKETVIVRSAQQADGSYKAVVRRRADGEYLRKE